MQLGKFERERILRKKEQAPTPDKPAPDRRSDFAKACAEAGISPHTVRRRMRPKHQRGQGMTLEEALAAPVMSHSEAGKCNRKRRKGES